MEQFFVLREKQVEKCNLIAPKMSVFAVLLCSLYKNLRLFFLTITKKSFIITSSTKNRPRNTNGYSFLTAGQSKEIFIMESQKKTFSTGFKKAIAIALMGTVCLTTAVSVGSLSRKVTVTDGNDTVTISTITPDTETILSKTGIELGGNDKLVRTEDDKDGVNISIIRAFDVDADNTKNAAFNESSVADSLLSAGMTLSNNESLSLAAALESNGTETEVKLARFEITVDNRGEEITKYVPAGSVKNALDYLKITLDKNDIIDVDANKAVQEGMKIEIKNVEYKTKTDVQTIDYKTTYEDTDELYEGESEVKVSGVQGERTIVTKERYVNGKLDTTETVSNEVTKEPVNKVILNGTKEKPAPTFTDGYIYPYLTSTMGRNLNGPSGQETYYNMPMEGVVSMMRNLGFSESEYPYWVREDGCKMLGNYIMVAAGLDVRPRGSLVQTSLGIGLVCDTGGFAYNDPYQLDIATAW